MKIFGWIQSKLSGQRFSKPNASKATKNDHKMHETSKEEDLSDLLTIGTLGNNSSLKEYPELDHQEITDEEFIQLQRELKLISSSHSEGNTEESPKHCLPADKLFDFLETLEDEQGSNATVVCNKGQDDHLYNKKEKKMSKKSVTFLLRKAFHTFGKFKLTSPLGDPIRELRLQEKTRFEKILRAILKKKVYPQSRNIPKGRKNKIMDQEHRSDCSDSDSGDEDTFESTSDGIKWVKTDSDYIVLEI